MAITYRTDINWVTDDGSYGYGTVITFDPEDISERQRIVYEDLDDDSKFSYIQAIMNGDPTDEWEEE